MNVGIIIQARLGSERLPNKVMMPLPTGDLVIDKIIREAKETELPVVVTTPDECLVDYIKMNWVTEVYHYAEDRNVLREFKDVLLRKDWNTVIRLTGDCPLITTERIKASLRAYEGSYLYCGPDGYDVEIFPRKDILGLTGDDEHVTRGLYSHITSLDTIEDYRKICGYLKQTISHD